MTLSEVQKRFRKLADKKKAFILQRFFKTGKGEYAEGDRFLGIVVPVTRKFARSCSALSLEVVAKLLRSKFHEERLLALILLTQKYRDGTPAEKGRIFRLYLKSARTINNWDLVDLSAPHIVGAYLENQSRHRLYRMAGSPSLWERRIAIVATFHFIRRNQFSDTLRIAAKLLSDPEDLIHKAAGWMLREVGKRDAGVLEKFLKKHSKQMPRTMLRYAIEKFPEAKRKYYLR